MFRPLFEWQVVGLDITAVWPRPRSATSRCATGIPVATFGLATLAVSVGEEQDTVEDVAEPYLLQLGFLQRTPRGRVATAAAFAHLGIEEPRGPGAAPAPGSLFERNPE